MTLKLINDRCPVCKVKPLSYKRDRYWFCVRCDRAFDMTDGEQIKNWAWKIAPGQTEPSFRIWPFVIVNNLPLERHREFMQEKV